MFRRDRPAFFFTFAFPIMFMVLFGLIFGAGGTSRPTVDVVGTGPLREALEQSDAIKLKAQPDEAHALKRVRDGDEPAAVLLRGRQRAPRLCHDLAGRGADRDRRRARHRRRLQPARRARQADGAARLRARRGPVARLRRPARARAAGDGDRPERGLRRRVLARRLAPEGHAAPAAPDAAAARRVRDARASSSTS